MFRIQEFPDVIADACLRDNEGRFLLLSLFGRDGAILQLISAMELPETKGGIQRLHVVDQDAREHLIDVGSTSRLAKFTGRISKRNIFGPLTHVWLYDQALLKPDLANRQMWVLHHDQAGSPNEHRHAEFSNRCWRAIKSLSPVPLLESWRDPVIDWCTETGAIRHLDDPLYPPLGPVQGARVSLGAAFLERISDLVRSGVLTLEDDRPEALTCVETQDWATETFLELGAVAYSEGVEQLLALHPDLIGSVLRRHQADDWGIVSSIDHDINVVARKHGGQIDSLYPIGADGQVVDDSDVVIQVSTDTVQQVTTVILQGEG
jgi:hypothetical protein